MNMKKSFRIFAVTLVIAVVVTVAGAVVVRHHNVKSGDMYEVFTNGINIGEPLYTYEIFENIDISEFPELTGDNYVMYQLNEFNTIETEFEHCTVEMNAGTQKDFLTIAMSCKEEFRDSVKLCTAVKDGNLYIQNKCEGAVPTSKETIKIIIMILDDYKGGYFIKGENSDITVTDAESAMNMEMSLHKCSVNVENLSAPNVTADMSGTQADFKNITSKDGFSIGAVSSNIKLSDITAQYSKALVSSTTLDVQNLLGSFNYESDISTLYLKCSEVSGNINLQSKKGAVNVTLPKNANISLRHNEKWSLFKNSTGIEESEKNNKDLQHILETNVEFTIVRLDEK